MANPNPVWFDGPQPPEGAVWCAICAMVYKQGGIQHHQKTIDAHNAGNGTHRTPRLDLARQPGNQELAVAVTRGLSILGPNFGMLDVCWSHIMGLNLTNGILPASPADAAMFSQARTIGGPR